MLPLLLGACMNAPGDAPLVLATGLGPLRSVTLAPDGRILAAGDRGAWLVSEQGEVAAVIDAPVTAVGSHPSTVYLLRGDAIEARPWPDGEARTFPAGGAVDLVATATTGELWLLTPDGVDALSVLDGARRSLVTGLHDGRALTLAPDGGALVLTGSSLSHLDAQGRLTGVVGALQDAHAVVVSGAGGAWVADSRGLLPALPGATPSGTVHPTDLAAAVRPALPATAAYLVTEDGLVGLVDLAAAGHP